jgi:hypothetical protein
MGAERRAARFLCHVYSSLSASYQTKRLANSSRNRLLANDLRLRFVPGIPGLRNLRNFPDLPIINLDMAVAPLYNDAALLGINNGIGPRCV